MTLVPLTKIKLQLQMQCQSSKMLAKTNFSMRSSPRFSGTSLARSLGALPPRRLRRVSVHASANLGEEAKRKKDLVDKIEKSLKETGLNPQSAKQILDNWQNEVGREVLSPEDLRRILVGQSTRALGLVLVNTLLDCGAAYGAFTAGSFLGVASEQYGTAAIIGQAIAYLLAGYYATGAVFDFFKLGAVLVARYNFSVNAGAFLEAIEDIAGGGTGLDIADKATQAVNSVKILNALNKMADLLKNQSTSNGSTSSAATDKSADILTDLGAFLTLQRAQTTYGFNAAEFGITDEEAATIAVIFGKFDVNDDGVLSEDEFRKLCSQYAPELNTAEEVKAALQTIDTNKDGSIQFAEFVRFWTKQV
jgi:Ca2+-binding EF-hand superfamily protein